MSEELQSAVGPGDTYQVDLGHLALVRNDGRGATSAECITREREAGAQATPEFDGTKVVRRLVLAQRTWPDSHAWLAGGTQARMGPGTWGTVLPEQSEKRKGELQLV